MEKTAMDELYGQTMAHAFIDELRELEKTAKLPGLIRNKLGGDLLKTIKQGIKPEFTKNMGLTGSQQSQVLHHVKGRKAATFTNIARNATNNAAHNAAAANAMKYAKAGQYQKAHTNVLKKREAARRSFSPAQTLMTPGHWRPGQLKPGQVT